MARTIPILIVLLPILGALLYQTVLYDVIFTQLGVGRKLQPLSDFNYECRRIQGPGLQGCEDMWLSESTRQLFMACSESASRTHWMPNIGRLNATGRSQGDHIIALDLDKPVGDGFEYRELETPDYVGTAGDRRLHLVGLTGIDREDNNVDLFLVNNRPSINHTTGFLADQGSVGANSTIEIFRINTQAETVQHIKTHAHPQIATPNNIAANLDGSFYYTNDHGLNKAGWRHEYSPVIKTGTVGFCIASGVCKEVASGYSFPNGLAFDADGLLYIPSSSNGEVVVYKPDPATGNLEKVDTIKTGYPLDNLSLDADGDLWIPGLPSLSQLMASFNDPMGAATPPATLLRIRKKPALPGPEGGKGGYEVEKVVEDAEGAVLPGATVVVHDVKTGRLFVGGVVSPFISVCERKAVITDEKKAGERAREDL